jgi:type I restriction enzyme S subunit
MQAAGFLGNLASLVEASDGIGCLRKVIVHLGITGRLLAQESSDTRAADLLQRIRSGTVNQQRSFPQTSQEEAPLCLPASWELCRLGEIAEIQMGNSPPGNSYNLSGDGVPPINGPVEFSKGPFGRTLKTKFTTAPAKLCRKGDLLICVRGSTTGRTNVAAFDACIGRGVALVCAHIVQDFLNYCILARREDVFSMGTGSTLPSVSQRQLYNLQVPVPPLEEQTRITTKLDELMSLCDELQAHQQRRQELRVMLNEAALDRLVTASDAAAFATAWQRVRDNFDLLYAVPENVAKLRQAILQLAVQGKLVPQDPSDEPAAAVIERAKRERQQLAKVGILKKTTFPAQLCWEDVPLTFPQSWQLCRLGELLVFGPTNGISPKPVERLTNTKSLTLSATTSGVFNPVHVKHLACDIPRDSPLWLQDGDILIQRSNTAQYVGIAAVYHGQQGQFVYPDLMMKLRVAKSVNVDYVHVVLNCEASREFYRRQATGTSGSMRKINQGVVCSLPVPIPPAAEQKRIVARVNELMSLCDDLEAKLKHQRDHADRLAQAIINAVVNGNTPDGKPASLRSP